MPVQDALPPKLRHTPSPFATRWNRESLYSASGVASVDTSPPKVGLHRRGHLPLGAHGSRCSPNGSPLRYRCIQDLENDQHSHHLSKSIQLSLLFSGGHCPHSVHANVQQSVPGLLRSVASNAQCTVPPSTFSMSGLRIELECRRNNTSELLSEACHANCAHSEDNDGNMHWASKH